jgi:hypothetical protein
MARKSPALNTETFEGIHDNFTRRGERGEGSKSMGNANPWMLRLRYWMVKRRLMRTSIMSGICANPVGKISNPSFPSRPGNRCRDSWRFRCVLVAKSPRTAEVGQDGTHDISSFPKPHGEFGDEGRNIGLPKT